MKPRLTGLIETLTVRFNNVRNAISLDSQCETRRYRLAEL